MLQDGHGEVDYEARPRSRPLVSFSQVERAIDEKLLNTDSVVILKPAVTVEEFEDLVERDFRVLGPLRVKYEPLIDGLGNIVVTLVKTPVHGRATVFASMLQNQLIAHNLGQGIRILMQGEGNIQAGRERREPDAEICIFDTSTGQSTDALVVEVAYSSPQDPEELRNMLNWYVSANTGVRIAVGIHVQYVPPQADLPEATSMTMYIRHRGDAIPEQILPFGEDVKDEEPVIAQIDSSTFFGDNPPPADYPALVEVDIRSLCEMIMEAIHRYRKTQEDGHSSKRGRGKGGHGGRKDRGGGSSGSHSISVQ
eukprot:TRINITY_DN3349_c1_g1_i1.p1 TRINITY_DN3349_c1_g1~~TRINITY_DN3349_c1_g1_i1.p1  ORF type:complete len:310 (-),score=63.37 TRINITY_DN3349_c1_g1_i1:37-966(-)